LYSPKTSEGKSRNVETPVQEAGRYPPPEKERLVGEVFRCEQHYGARTEKQSHQSYRFISNSLFRSYVFNYYHGSSLLNRYLATGNRIERFRTLLEQPLMPSRVKHWIAQSNI